MGAFDDFQGIFGGELFGFFFGAALALAHDFVVEEDGDGEAAFVGVAVFSADFVGRGFSPHGLGDFLKAGFVVVGGDIAGADLHQVGVELLQDEPAGFFEAGFDVDGADDGFENVAEDGGTVTSAGGLFAGAKEEEFVESEGLGAFGEGSFLDDRGAGFGHHPLIPVGVVFVEILGDDEAEDGVAVEFKPFVAVFDRVLGG